LIGASLRKVRLEAGLSLDDVAEQVAIKPEQLESYELGQFPLPVTTLEVLTETLGVSMKEFYDKKGPVGKWVNQQQMVKDFLQLPPEMQAFVSKPVNRPYLELAQRLGDMSVDKLRSVAEVLLEITL
jgi:transcriptional regulator with XRE-family HTH domain